MPKQTTQPAKVKVGLSRLFQISFKNGRPLLGAALLAAVLVLALDNGCRCSNVPVDAFLWPSSINTSSNPEALNQVAQRAQQQTNAIPLLVSGTFSLDEVARFSTLVNRLTQRSDPVGAFLWQRLSIPEQSLLTHYERDASTSDEVQHIVVQALNEAVGGACVYERERFRGVLLRPQTTDGLKRNPTGLELAHLNRLLLEDAFPDELLRNPPNSLNGGVLHRILAITSFVLIFGNTYLYLKDSPKSLREKRSRPAAIAWHITYWFQFVVLLWIIKLFSGIRLGRYDDEYVAFILFSVFMFVDWVSYRRTAAMHYSAPRDLRLLEESRFALNQALFVDAPVVAGAFISIILALYLDRKFPGSEHYLLGYFAGATLMQLATSQIIYFILAFNKDLALAKGGLR